MTFLILIEINIIAFCVDSTIYRDVHESLWTLEW